MTLSPALFLVGVSVSIGLLETRHSNSKRSLNASTSCFTASSICGQDFYTWSVLALQPALTLFLIGIP